MGIRFHSLYLIILLVICASIQSSPIWGENFNKHYSLLNLVNIPSSVIQRSNFISLLCQRQKQHPIELKTKLCSNYIQSYNVHADDDDEGQKQQEQREKRVGWTISV
ncbi:unnamed protein product [Rotaria magnacalcarata]|uniref:Uncharacterized protein n=1 Tax=Rotaria magnacalcarata TaxID=392030 RepID=A0A814RRF2_9BILA|nr:unnamed protein product [Rotaria magnacalcarata]CAF1301160.1 unnamed protein product [Rotaria magnacalcarata]CAF2055118.1 unnamed protein product [Rotaria magnacalcarata]CAF2100889.1 unnamed protein product [Rotaria magnacalcarata]CAF2141327.1 unnamed protein product [Rotaria magnacalcarata]